MTSVHGTRFVYKNNNNNIKVLYSAHLSTKQGTQGTEYIQTFRKKGYCSNEL